MYQYDAHKGLGERVTNMTDYCQSGLEPVAQIRALVGRSALRWQLCSEAMGPAQGLALHLEHLCAGRGHLWRNRMVQPLALRIPLHHWYCQGRSCSF